ncbi:MarR family winged helix-turn-helix transcriptional regulator [Herbiconiux sp. VKM Ac-2851]|uniref:MarR family winged helix-turn-helix transcriptional regulator n=1 Tax=Herbiconiux sp. VKM Ac-2851 TaxID=2739025 RepID=UPI001566C9A2|nr:MarR family transcriptional regulator [Herbiconiux sp. VKM Ac-2851]NQX33280.1 MarR family transcriptional regulator [Herbiconiux sp. VKM Ac-2851]
MPTDLELLGQALKRAQYRNHRTMDTALQDVGVSLVQWDALRAIDQAPGASAHALAIATFQSDQAFGTLATRLVARGLVARTPGHGRRLEHTLTPAGADALAAGRRIAAAQLPALFAPLDEPQRSALFEALTALTLV